MSNENEPARLVSESVVAVRIGSLSLPFVSRVVFVHSRISDSRTIQHSFVAARSGDRIAPNHETLSLALVISIVFAKF